LHQIALRSKEDPLIGAKIGSKEVTQRLLAGMKTERGVHVESLLCALGSVSGYACQAAVRAQAAAKGLAETAPFICASAQEGDNYYFGDALNRPLAESQYSVWSLAGGGAQAAGCTELPDMHEMFKHVTDSIGKPTFGLPRTPDTNKPGDTPINYVRSLWPALRPLVVKFCPNPEHWPVLLGLSAQEAIIMGKGVIDPGLAFRIVMESAIPMSKVELGKV